MKPLRVFEGRPELAASLIDAIDALPAEVAAYKMLHGDVADVAKEYLRRCQSRAGSSG